MGKVEGPSVIGLAAAAVLPGLLAFVAFQRGGEPPRPAVWSMPEKGPQTLFVINAVDGDTLDAAYLVPIRVRLHGINAPELRTEAGKRSKMFLAALVDGRLLPAELHGREKYGRLLADFTVGGKRLSDTLIEAGHAKAWDGDGPRP